MQEERQNPEHTVDRVLTSYSQNGTSDTTKRQIIKGNLCSKKDHELLRLRVSDNKSLGTILGFQD